MFRKILSIATRQYNIGNWWGGFKNVASSATIYITALNLILLAVTAYGTTIAPWMWRKGISMPFVVFLGIILLGILLVFAFEYKLSIPSIYSFWNEQWWRHDNPMRRKIEDMDKRMKKMEKILKTLARIEKAKKC